VEEEALVKFSPQSFHETDIFESSSIQFLRIYYIIIITSNTVLNKVHVFIVYLLEYVSVQSRKWCKLSVDVEGMGACDVKRWAVDDFGPGKAQ